MKKTTILAALLALVALTGGAKEKTTVWEHPAAAENRQIEGYFSTLLEITRVEFDKDETRVRMRVALRPDFKLKFSSDTHLMADGKRYALTKCEGLELDKMAGLPNNGKTDVVFHFEPLPATTERFDFIEGDGQAAFNVLGVEDKATRARRLFPSNWRNERTGDWEISFYDDFAIYDCRFWQYKQRQQKGDKYTFVLASDGREMAVSVERSKAGRRTMTIDGKTSEYAVITSITLPDYPAKDTSTVFRDTHYRTDTVTLVGWLKDMTQKEKDKGDEYVVNYNDIFMNKWVSSYGKIDSLGRFVVKIPLLNSSAVSSDWDRTFIRTLFEPGETYFLLYDFKSGHKLFMGKNCRLQNELLSYPMGWLHGTLDYDNDMDEAATMQYLESLKQAKAALMAELDRTVEAHPTISDRYIAYLTMNYNTVEGRELMQGRYYMKGRNVPPAYLEYVSQHHWQQRSRPYTLFDEFSTFQRDYVYHLHTDRYGIKFPQFILLRYSEMEAPILRRYREAGKVAITDEELAIVECHAAEKAEAEKPEYEKQYDNIIEREDVRQVLEAEGPLFPLYGTDIILDSIGCDRDLRDIVLTHNLYRDIYDNRRPFNASMMQYIEENISMPAAKAFLQAEQEKYLAIQRKDVAKSASLKSADDVADMSDGEKILRKITEPYRGRLILLDVWGTWCSPCKEALSHSKEEFERLKDYDLVYLYLANLSSDESWRNVIKEYDLTGDNIVHYNLPASQQSAIEHFLGVQSFPTYKIIDREGNVLDVNADPRYSLEGLAKLLDGLK